MNIVEQLSEDAKHATNRLAVRLRQALRQHDLTRQELLAAQRAVSRLTRIGAQPGPTEYWQRSALPRAAELIDQSMIAVMDEGTTLGEALDRFLQAINGPSLNEWADRALDEALLRRATLQPISRLVEAVPTSQAIDALGTWWQHRLHRTAVWRSLPKLLVSFGDAELIVGKTEMALLDGPPWCHGDRLLSAFELAHGEIRNQTELVVEGLTARVATRGRRYLSPSQRVTIELRH